MFLPHSLYSSYCSRNRL